MHMRETQTSAADQRPSQSTASCPRQPTGRLRGRTRWALLASCALTPGLAQARSGIDFLSNFFTMSPAALAWVLAATVVLGMLTDLAARHWGWRRWLGLSLLARRSHIAAGLATLSLAAAALAVMPALEELLQNFGELPAPSAWMFKLRWLLPLILPLWALGLWRAGFRQRPTWSLSWALACMLLLGLLPHVHWHVVN